jgi:hypothetical protein
MHHVAYKTVTCGRCLNEWVVYYDIQNKGSMCPVCNKVEGIIWDEEGTYKFQRADGTTFVPDDRRLTGEEQYDWDWLLYDKSNNVGG